MATKYWLGNAAVAAQVSTGVIASVDATPSNNTFTVTIGGVAVSVAGVTNANATAAALVAALNASTNLYFSSITWTNPSGANITGMADTAGSPFIPVISKTGGGTGTVTAFSTSVPSAGPNDWSTAANWSDNVVPTTGDTVIIANSAVNIAYGLLTGATGLTLIRIEQSYTGKIGLDYQKFATSADGATVNSSYPEYRQLYLSIGCSSIRIGDSSSIGTPAGSGRIMIDTGSTTTATVEVINTASASADSSRPAVRLLANKSASALNVRLAPGGVGVAAEVPAETSTIGTINISDTTSTSKIVTGRGLTLTTWIQDGGNNVLQSDQTITTITVNGGTLRTEGSGATTTFNVYGGTTLHNSTGTTATINVNGGSISSFGSATARTWTTINLYERSTLIFDPAVITNTNGITPAKRVTIAT